MVQTRPRFYSFDDYLAYDDGTENFYELFNGELGQTVVCPWHHVL
jgi:hypothetical protein